MIDKLRNKGIFREEALYQIECSQSNHHEYAVATCSHWVGLVAVLAIMSGLVTWFFYIPIEYEVYASGMIVNDLILEKNRKLLAENIKDRQIRFDAANDILEKKEMLFNRKLITRQDISQSRDEYLVAKEELQRAKHGDDINIDGEIDDNKPGMLSGTAFVSLIDGKKVLIGQQVKILPSALSKYEYGYLTGRITYVSAYPINKRSAYYYLYNKEYINEILSHGSQYLIKIALDKNPATNEYKWTITGDKLYHITEGTPINVNIIIKAATPYQSFTHYL